MSNIRTYEITHCEQKVFPIQQKDSTDYFIGGSLVMKNGKIDKILFDGGYAQDTSANSTTDKFAFYYYNQDHLGNNREVVDANGVVQQVTNYYPFGAPYVDATAVKCDSLQPYKYNGKELDLMHGLNTYDYGARQYNPVTGRWDRIDPLCEKYYSISPYAYCVNNPVMFLDPDGRDLYLSGTYKERMYLLQLLQKLTNDRLDMNRKTGQVTIGKVGTKNLDKNGKATLTSGTKLIAGIINNHKHRMTIKTNNEGKCDTGYPFRADAWNKEKGTDANITIDLNHDYYTLSKYSWQKKATWYKQPLCIALGHELIHGNRAMYGMGSNKKAGDYKLTSFDYINEKGITMECYGEGQEELETMGIDYFNTSNHKFYKCSANPITENALRKEHGYPIRQKH